MSPLPTLCALASLAATAFAGDWPTWRGPAGTGVAESAPPASFGADENVRWSIELPGRGCSTPIIVGETVYVTTAAPTGKPAEAQPDPEPEPEPEGRGRGRGRGRRGFGAAQLVEQSFDLLAIDRASGELRWRETLATATPHEGYHGQYGSWASASPVFDGEHLFVSFGSFGLFCVDLEGELVWKADPGAKLVMRRSFGEGATPVVHGDVLFHAFDHEGDSFAIAYDKRSGEELWRVDRDEPSVWAQPIVIEHGGETQVVASGTNRVRGYRLADGEVLWECGGLGVNAIPALVRHDDLILAMSGYQGANLIAIRLGGEGDVTAAEGAIAWSSPKGCSYTASPVLVGGKYYTVTDRGFISCFDATTGEGHYVEERLPRGSTLKASPVAADGKLYVPTEAGDVHVIRLGETYEVLGTHSFGEHAFIASPALVDGELYLRSMTHLFCVAETGEERGR